MDRKTLAEMVLDFAGDFINQGQHVEERRNRLNSACTAWNCAYVPEKFRNQLLDRCVHEYQKWNPHADDIECQAIRDQMEFLIKLKLKKYPHVIKQIVSCDLQVINGQDHITVASARENG